jgi:hypothetical protein
MVDFFLKVASLVRFLDEALPDFPQKLQDMHHPNWRYGGRTKIFFLFFFFRFWFYYRPPPRPFPFSDLPHQLRDSKFVMNTRIYMI